MQYAIGQNESELMHSLYPKILEVLEVREF